jgi:uncharacterized Zn finger protein
MCKHVAAALYGVGARLDNRPELLFVLRGVDENELIAGAGQGIPLSKTTSSSGKVLDDSDVAAVFGLEMVETLSSLDTLSDTKQPKVSKRHKAVAKAKLKGRPPDNTPRVSPTKPKSKSGASVRTRNRLARHRPPARP